MKIAYVGNFSQPHCTEVHIASTLESLGHEVVRIQETVSREDDFWTNKVIGSDLFLFTRTWGKMVTLDDLSRLKQHGIPTASYHLDLYVGLKRESGLDSDPFWRTDYVFTPDGSEMAAEVFKRMNINHFYIKPGVFEKECYITPISAQQFRRDVVFVGGGEASDMGQRLQYGHREEWPYRGQLIKFLRDTYGTRFQKFGWPQPTIRNDPLNQLYSSTKVVVGDSLCLNFDHPYYWSDRVYETMGRGGFIIHPYIKGMEEEFTDKENIVFYNYNDWDQLKALIDYYLVHDEERERIRRAGHEFVKKNATYTNRLQQAIGIIFKDQPDKIFDVPLKESDELFISLGAGSEVETEENWVNVDIVELPGIDVVHNLMHYPWPFKDNSADFIKAKDIIEHMATHLPDGSSSLIAFIDECHRILKPGGTLWIQTPRYDADFLYIDPTHVRGFHEQSMDFFDPETDFGRSTGFYSESKFKVACEVLENKNLQYTMVKR